MLELQSLRLYFAKAGLARRRNHPAVTWLQNISNQSQDVPIALAVKRCFSAETARVVTSTLRQPAAQPAHLD
jgi:hypothetical protein